METSPHGVFCRQRDVSSADELLSFAISSRLCVVAFHSYIWARSTRSLEWTITVKHAMVANLRSGVRHEQESTSRRAGAAFQHLANEPKGQSRLVELGPARSAGGRARMRAFSLKEERESLIFDSVGNTIEDFISIGDYVVFVSYMRNVYLARSQTDRSSHLQ